MVEAENLVVPKETTWKYRTDKVHLVPYVDGNKSSLFSDEFLFYLYSRCKEDKIIDVLFPGTKMTPARFVGYLKDRTVLVGFVKPEFEVAGFAFLYEVEGGQEGCKGTVGFVFFRKWWGRVEIKDISTLALRWWFDEVKLKIIFGTTLWRNRLAWKFARFFGFESVGKLPRFFFRDEVFEDAHLMYLTPEKFFATCKGD